MTNRINLDPSEWASPTKHDPYAAVWIASLERAFLDLEYLADRGRLAKLTKPNAAIKDKAARTEWSSIYHDTIPWFRSRSNKEGSLKWHLDIINRLDDYKRIQKRHAPTIARVEEASKKIFQLIAEEDARAGKKYNTILKNAATERAHQAFLKSLKKWQSIKGFTLLELPNKPHSTKSTTGKGLSLVCNKCGCFQWKASPRFAKLTKPTCDYCDQDTSKPRVFKSQVVMDHLIRRAQTNKKDLSDSTKNTLNRNQIDYLFEYTKPIQELKIGEYYHKDHSAYKPAQSAIEEAQRVLDPPLPISDLLHTVLIKEQRSSYFSRRRDKFAK